MFHKTSFSCFHVIKSKMPAVKLCTHVNYCHSQHTFVFFQGKYQLFWWCMAAADSSWVSSTCTDWRPSCSPQTPQAGSPYPGWVGVFPGQRGPTRSPGWPDKSERWLISHNFWISNGGERLDINSRFLKVLWEDVTLLFCLEHRCLQAFCTSFSSYLLIKVEVDKSRIIWPWFFKILKANLHYLVSPTRVKLLLPQFSLERKLMYQTLHSSCFYFHFCFTRNDMEIWSLETKYHCYSDLFEEKKKQKISS